MSIIVELERRTALGRQMHPTAKTRVALAGPDPELFEPGEKPRREFIGQSEHRLRARLAKPLCHLLEDRFGGNVFSLGLEVQQQPMTQTWDDRVVDIVVADADPSREQRVDLRAEDHRLRAARARPET